MGKALWAQSGTAPHFGLGPGLWTLTPGVTRKKKQRPISSCSYSHMAFLLLTRLLPAASQHEAWAWHTYSYRYCSPSMAADRIIRNMCSSHYYQMDANKITDINTDLFKIQWCDAFMSSVRFFCKTWASPLLKALWMVLCVIPLLKTPSHLSGLAYQVKMLVKWMSFTFDRRLGPLAVTRAPPL